MRLLEVLDRGLGMIVGAVTGLLVPFFQIPYAYILFAQSMRRAKYNWFNTILGTLTIGSVAALLTAFTSLTLILFAPFYGMMIGLQEGLFHRKIDGGLNDTLLGSLSILNITPGNRFEKKIVFFFTDNNTFAWESDRSVVTWVMQYLMLGAFPFAELIQSLPGRDIDHHALENGKYQRYVRREEILRSQTVFESARMMLGRLNQRESNNPIDAQRETENAIIISEAIAIVGRNALMTIQEYIIVVAGIELISQYQSAILPDNNPASSGVQSRNAGLLASLPPPQEVKNVNIDLLSEAEIEAVKQKIQTITDTEEQKKHSDQLKNYLEAVNCPITRCQIQDPVTVVEGNKSRVYENSALRMWIEQQNSTSVDALDPQSKTPLKDLSIYNGYPEFVTTFVSDARKFLNSTVTMPNPITREGERNARLKLFDPKYKEPASSSISSLDATSANTLKPNGKVDQQSKG